MIPRKHTLLMTTTAALCALPFLAFGQVQPNPRDGTPGNPPSTATQRTLDRATGERTDADGTGNNPPGTAAGRTLERAGDAAQGAAERAGDATRRAADSVTPNTTTTTTPSGTTTTTTTGATTTGTATGTMAVDSARMQGGRRASRLIGTNIYNEANETVGEVEDIIIPTGGGNPVAILSVGGFLGIGDRLVAVPFERLQRAADRDRWVLPGATRDGLKELPAYSHEEADRRR
ncbi:PRC-barrel domain-containing protein [Falsiroseomonas sp.]|uniref:PRC-barrel domain-containing protein n=1 Tax=Falsiroseomonas sp. TaxID=2870721 RepID=UPI00356525B3